MYYQVEIESLKKELVEKQELLSQAATAFEVIEQQKEASSRNQAQYQLSLEHERERIANLEKGWPQKIQQFIIIRMINYCMDQKLKDNHFRLIN